MEFRPIF